MFTQLFSFAGLNTTIAKSLMDLNRIKKRQLP